MRHGLRLHAVVSTLVLVMAASLAMGQSATPAGSDAVVRADRPVRRASRAGRPAPATTLTNARNAEPVRFGSQAEAAAEAGGTPAPLLDPGEPAIARDSFRPMPQEQLEGRTLDGEPLTPHEFNGDVRDLPPVPVSPRVKKHLHQPVPSRPAPVSLPLEQEYANVNIPLAPAPSPTQNFAGLSLSPPVGVGGAGWPPDPNGDVGPNHYVQAINDAFAIYNKSGTLLASFTENSLWAGGTSPCSGNSYGDPVVIYDRLADRWILTNMAFAAPGGTPTTPFYECIAVSKTNDPVGGGWYLYPVRMDPGGTGLPPINTINDYPKFGIWTDCLYMAANGFTMPTGSFAGTMYASFSRSDLYSGAASPTWALGFLNSTTDPFTMIPSNLTGQAAPPNGTLNYFVSESMTAWAFEVRKFTPGGNCGGGGTLAAPVNVTQATYTFPANTNFVPQPGTTNKLDTIGDRLMQKVQYRKVGSAESLWVVHNVQPSSSSVMGMQWAQLDVTGGTIATTPVQQQIYAPDSSLHRWMGSIAADGAGNVAIGYSTSNGTAPNYPSIAYAGRLAGDPANQLPQSETQLVAGAGSQSNTCGGSPCQRWGDYSAMSVDPVDDCTFWYTNEYYGSLTDGTNGNWSTRIGAFKFPGCGSSAPSTDEPHRPLPRRRP